MSPVTRHQPLGLLAALALSCTYGCPNGSGTRLPKPPTPLASTPSAPLGLSGIVAAPPKVLSPDGQHIALTAGGFILGPDGATLVAAGGGNVFGQNGASLVAAGGGNLVGNDGASLVAAGGGNLIGNDGSTLVAAGGGNLVGNDGASLVAAGGGNMVAAGGGHFALLAAGLGLSQASGNPASPAPTASTSTALHHALVTLTGLDEHFFTNRSGEVYATTTDAGGTYHFPPDIQLPAGREVFVNAVVDGRYRFTGVLSTPAAAPAGGAPPLALSQDIDLATTLATEYLRGEVMRRGTTFAAFDRAGFAEVIALTRKAIADKAILADVTMPGADKKATPGTRFALGIDQSETLRDQYALAIAVARRNNGQLKGLSDAWLRLTGLRPLAVTTFAGTGELPDVKLSKVDGQNVHGAVSGNWGKGPRYPAAALPMGEVAGVAASLRGDVFITSRSTNTASGHIRWIKPTGEVSSIWLQGHDLDHPAGVIIEQEPTDTTAGTLLVADLVRREVLRVPIEDQATYGARAAGGVAGPRQALHPITVLAGEADGLRGPEQLARDARGDIWIVDDGRIMRLAHDGGKPVVVASDAGQGDDTSLATLRLGPFSAPGIHATRTGQLYVSFDGLVAGVSASGRLTQVAGPPPRASGASADASEPIAGPLLLTSDPSGRLFVAEQERGILHMVTRDGRWHRIAGRPATGALRSQDGDARNGADLELIDAIAVDPLGNLLLTDGKYRRVRKVWTQWE